MVSNPDPDTLTGSQAKRTARIAAALFLFGCVPAVTWSNNIGSKIFLPLDPAGTAQNLLANEFLFRSSIATHLLSNWLFAFMIFLFYRLFKPVNKHLARLMVAPVLAQVAIFVILEVFNYGALMILKSETRFAFDDAQRQEISFLFLRLHRFGIGASQGLWGLAFIPFGLLSIRCGFVPRIFGYLLVIGGFAYVVDTSLYILLERASYLAARIYVQVPMNTGYVIMLWFLIKGVRQPESTQNL